MSAARLIPKTDESPFPYDDALRLLILDNSEMNFCKKDFGPLIEAGRRFHWTEETLRINEEMAARGKCYDFDLAIPPFVRGTLYEDNVFITIGVYGEYEKDAADLVKQWAKQLDVRLRVDR